MAPTRDPIFGEAGSKNKRKSAQPPEPAAQPPKCPECGSRRNWQDGHRYPENKPPIQRYKCRTCGYRFDDPKRSPSERKIICAPRHNIGDCQVCVSDNEMENLSTVETRQKQAERGATTQEDIQGQIVEFMWSLKKQGFPETTIKSYAKQIRRLHNLSADLMKPESVLIVIASHDEWSNTYKRHFVNAYDHWAKLHGLTWIKPRYRQQQKLPWIPAEEEIDVLVAGCGKKTATFLQLVKETAMRYREAWLLKWEDLDFKKETVNVRSAKRGKPRELRISQKLMGMLNRLPRTSERVFGSTGYSTMRNNLTEQRKRIAEKIQNPRILRITFHTLRHWRASIEYHRGRKLIEIKEMLGHNSIQSTMIYTHLIESAESDEWISRATGSVKGARTLIEAGFEYITEMNGLKLFRKRK